MPTSVPDAAPLWRKMTIAVVAPSYRRDRGPIETGLEFLRWSGFRVMTGPLVERTAHHGDPYARQESRLQELLHALYDDRVDAIWCVDGGAGASYLLPLLAKAYEERPWLTDKSILGFSDATALLLYLRKLGHPAFYATNVACETETDASDLRTTVEALLHNERKWSAPVDVIQGGSFVGRLWPGCLSLHAQLRGTPYAPDYTDGVLMLEEHGPETPGQHEYLLWEKLAAFELAGVWSPTRAMLFGEIETTGPYADQEDLFPTVSELLEQHVLHVHPTAIPSAAQGSWGNSGLPMPLPFDCVVKGFVGHGRVNLEWSYPQAWIDAWALRAKAVTE